MSTDSISIDLQERAVLGKGLTGLRASGQIPAVIHDHGNESIHVMADAITMRKVYAAAGKHHPVELTVGGKQHLALIKDADFEPTKHDLRHIVFQAIKQNEAVEAEIPIVFLADAEIPAERKSLLVLKQLDHVAVKALPKDLPDELVVDPSTLEEVGDSLTVADLKAPEGVIILTEEHAQIAVVEMPRDQIAEADAAAAALTEDAAAHGEEGAPAEEAPAEGAKATEETSEEKPTEEKSE